MSEVKLIAKCSDERPSIGSKWVHRNGIPYTVLMIANEPGHHDYPVTVVYQGPNGKVWARPLSIWYASMQITEEKI